MINAMALFNNPLFVIPDWLLMTFIRARLTIFHRVSNMHRICHRDSVALRNDR